MLGWNVRDSIYVDVKGSAHVGINKSVFTTFPGYKYSLASTFWERPYDDESVYGLAYYKVLTIQTDVEVRLILGVIQDAIRVETMRENE